jgi:hypothetical protein
VVPLIEAPRSFDGVRVVFIKCFEKNFGDALCISREVLPAFVRQVLSGNERGLILEMQEKPKFKARVRKRDVDIVSGGPV